MQIPAGHDVEIYRYQRFFVQYTCLIRMVYIFFQWQDFYIRCVDIVLFIVGHIVASLKNVKRLLDSL